MLIDQYLSSEKSLASLRLNRYPLLKSRYSNSLAVPAAQPSERLSFSLLRYPPTPYQFIDDFLHYLN